MEYGLPEIAALYVKDKAGLIRLMSERYGKAVSGDTPNNVLIAELKRSYEQDPLFRNDLHDLMNKNGIVTNYNNAVFETIMAGLGIVGGAVTSVSDTQRAKIEAQAQEDKFFQDYILAQQSKSNVGKIVLISVISLAAIGLTAWLVLRKK